MLDRTGSDTCCVCSGSQMDENEKETKEGAMALIRSPVLRKYFLTLVFAWYAALLGLSQPHCSPSSSRLPSSSGVLQVLLKPHLLQPFLERGQLRHERLPDPADLWAERGAGPHPQHLAAGGSGEEGVSGGHAPDRRLVRFSCFSCSSR